MVERPLSTLRYWRHVGYGPKSFKLGGRVAYKLEDVEQWIESQYSTPTTWDIGRANEPANSGDGPRSGSTPEVARAKAQPPDSPKPGGVESIHRKANPW